MELIEGELIGGSQGKGHIGAEEWAMQCLMWESGASSEEIGRRFNRNPSHLTVKFKKAGIKKGSRKEEYSEKLKQDLETDMNKNISLKVQLASETNNDAYSYAQAIQKIMMARLTAKVKQTDADGQPVSLVGLESDFKVLEKAIKILDTGNNVRRKSLGIDRGDIVDPDQMPQLVLMEMTPEDVQMEKLAAEEKLNKKEMTDAELEAVIEGLEPVKDEELKAKTEALRKQVRAEESDRRRGDDKNIVRDAKMRDVIARDMDV